MARAQAYRHYTRAKHHNSVDIALRSYLLEPSRVLCGSRHECPSSTAPKTNDYVPIYLISPVPLNMP
jgi:hypothetical protein